MDGELANRLDEAVSKLPEDLRELAVRDIEILKRDVGLSWEKIIWILESESADPTQRSTAAWIVGLVGEVSLAKILSSVVLETREEQVLWEITKTLCKLHQGGPQFQEMLRNGPTLDHRKASAYALGHLGDSASTVALTQVLSSRDEPLDLRCRAAEALGYLRDPTSLSALLTAASDASAEVRFWSVFALGQLGDRRAAPLLEMLVQDDHAIVEGWWSVSQEAAAALAEIGRAEETE